VKNTLDDSVKKVLNENYQWTEKHTLADGRLAISTIAVAFAAVALVYDYLHPFPLSKWVLFGCSTTYFILMGVLQIYQWYWEQAVFYQAVDEDPTGKTANRYWKWSSTMKRYDDKYTLEAEYDQGARKGHKNVVKSVAAYINDDGEVQMALLKKEVMHLHDALFPPGKMN